MKLKYPAEAFALGIVLFSAGMKEAFAAGILVIFSVVFAELLKNLLEKAVPAWSLRLCVCIAAASLSSSVFLVGFAFMGESLETGVWLMTFAVGLLCARHVLEGGVEAEYGDLLFEGAVAWGFWILLSITRELAGSGQIFGNTVWQASFQSKAFLETPFAFLAAGLTLAFTNGVLKKECRDENSFLAAVPAMVLLHPFTATMLGETAGLIWSILVPVALFWSVKQTLRYSRAGRAYRGLPVEMLAAGLIYMILGIY